MKKPLFQFNWEKSDFYCLGMILLYAIYAYIGNITIDCDNRTTLTDLPCVPTFVIYVISLSIYGIVIYNTSKSNWTGPESGLDLGKGFWWSLLIAVILAVLIAYENQTFSISAVAQLTPLLVYYFASEMVLRAILITRIIKIFGHTTAASILAVIISAVIFAITHEPYSGSVTAMFIMSVLLSGVYLAFHSILLMVIAGLYTSVVYATAGNSQFSYLPLVIIMTLVLYIILAIPARLIGNRHKSFPQPE